VSAGTCVSTGMCVSLGTYLERKHMRERGHILERRHMREHRRSLHGCFVACKRTNIDCRCEGMHTYEGAHCPPCL